MFSIARGLRSFGGDLLALIAPRRCPFCGEADGEPLCPSCRQSLPWAERGEDCIAVFLYRDSVREAILRFKFHGAEHLARPLGKIMADRAAQAAVRADFVSFVPSSRLRVLKRGYQHTKLLACTVAEELSLPLKATLLRKHHGKPQTTMADDAARRQNVLHSFAPLCSLQGQRILLCDDIRTSGSTLEACRRVLLHAGASEVIPLVIGRRQETYSARIPTAYTYEIYR